MKKTLRFIIVSLFLLFCWPIFLYKIYGNTNYKLQGRTIIICNHYSNFDAFFIYLIYGKSKKIHFVTITETKTKLWSRFITWLFDCLYIDYNSTNVSFFKQCIDILNNDGVICIFPEGFVNSRRYGFFDFKASYVLLARKTDSLILPLYIYPELSPFKKSLIYIGDPLKTEDYSKYVNRDDASTHIQCKVMNYASIINKIVDDKQQDNNP